MPDVPSLTKIGGWKCSTFIFAPHFGQPWTPSMFTKPSDNRSSHVLRLDLMAIPFLREYTVPRPGDSSDRRRSQCKRSADSADESRYAKQEYHIVFLSLRCILYKYRRTCISILSHQKIFHAKNFSLTQLTAMRENAIICIIKTMQKGDS
jgi:hypothetical protein